MRIAALLLFSLFSFQASAGEVVNFPPIISNLPTPVVGDSNGTTDTGVFIDEVSKPFGRHSVRRYVYVLE